MIAIKPAKRAKYPEKQRNAAAGFEKNIPRKESAEALAGTRSPDTMIVFRIGRETRRRPPARRPSRLKLQIAEISL